MTKMMQSNSHKSFVRMSRYLDLFAAAFAQSLALGLVVALSTFTGAFLGIHAGHTQVATTSSGRFIPLASANENAGAAQAEEAPSGNLKRPPVYTKEADEDAVAGAKYPAGPETVVDPSGGDVRVTDEPMVEDLGDDADEGKSHPAKSEPQRESANTPPPETRGVVVTQEPRR